MNTTPHTIFDPRTACLTEEAMFNYIDGKLSPSEAHALEKHVLDCAFCSEALEGLELVKDRSKVRAAMVFVEELEEKKKNEGGGRIIPFNFRTRLAAAAVIILLIGSALLYKITQSGYDKKETAQQIIKTEEQKPDAGPVVTTSDDQTFAKNFEPYPADTIRIVTRNESATGVSRLVQSERDNVHASYEKAPAENYWTDAGAKSKHAETTTPPPASPALADNIPAQSDKLAKTESYKKDEGSVVKEEKADKQQDLDQTKLSGDDEANLRENDGKKQEAEKNKSKEAPAKAERKKTTRSVKPADFKGEPAGAPATTPDDQRFANAPKTDQGPPASGKYSETISQGLSKTTVTPKDREVSGNNKAVADSTSNVRGFISLNQSNTVNANISTPASKDTKAGGAAPMTYSWSPAGGVSGNAQGTATTVNAGTYLSSKSGEKTEGYTLSAADANACTTAPANSEAGMDAYRKKDFQKAITDFNKVLSIDPGNSTALFYAGVSYLSLNPPDITNALLCLNKVLSDPKTTYGDAAKWYKSLALIKASRKEEAKPILNELSKGKSSYRAKAPAVLKEIDAK